MTRQDRQNEKNNITCAFGGGGGGGGEESEKFGPGKSEKHNQIGMASINLSELCETWIHREPQ